MTENPIRILQVSGRLNRGGAETMIINLYREVDISRIQFDFLVYQESDGSFDDEIIQRGGRVLYLDRPNKFNIIQYYCDLKTLVKENGPYQAIHVHTQFHSGFVLLCARFLGVPIRICHAHSTADASSISLIRRLYQSIMRKLIKLNATQLLACGNDAGFFLYGDSNWLWHHRFSLYCSISSINLCLYQININHINKIMSCSFLIPIIHTMYLIIVLLSLGAFIVFY
jgi:glycosyltransferase EpsF